MAMTEVNPVEGSTEPHSLPLIFFLHLWVNFFVMQSNGASGPSGQIIVPTRIHSALTKLQLTKFLTVSRNPIKQIFTPVVSLLIFISRNSPQFVETQSNNSSHLSLPYWSQKPNPMIKVHSCDIVHCSECGRQGWHQGAKRQSRDGKIIGTLTTCTMRLCR